MLRDKLQDDLKQALKAGDSVKRSVIGMVMAAVKNKEIEKHDELNDDEILAVIASEVKKRKDSAEQYQKAQRPELAEKEEKEIIILQNYLPEQLSDREVRQEIENAIQETEASSIKDMGKVIGVVMAKVKNRADGQRVSQLVKDMLNA